MVDIFVCLQKEPRRRSYNSFLAFPHVVRPVEDISQMELDLIANNVREKVYNSFTVSSHSPTVVLKRKVSHSYCRVQQIHPSDFLT